MSKAVGKKWKRLFRRRRSECKTSASEEHKRDDTVQEEEEVEDQPISEEEKQQTDSENEVQSEACKPTMNDATGSYPTIENNTESVASPTPVETSFQSTDPVVDNEEYRVLKEVDSADVPEPERSFFEQLVSNMNPLQCLPMNLPEAVDTCGVMAYKSCVAGATEEFEWLLPGMLNDIENGSAKTRASALQRLYRLVDRDHKDNRYVHTEFLTCQTQLVPYNVMLEPLPYAQPSLEQFPSCHLAYDKTFQNQTAANLFSFSTIYSYLTKTKL